MAESEDAREAEAAETTVSGAALGVALATAVGRRKAKAGADPELDAFLAEHTRLAQLQSEQLRETLQRSRSRARRRRLICHWTHQRRRNWQLQASAIAGLWNLNRENIT